jgi:hypothetical protein
VDSKEGDNSVNHKEVILEILQLIQDLSCMIGNRRDPFLSEKLKQTYDRAEELRKHLT